MMNRLSIAHQAIIGLTHRVQHASQHGYTPLTEVIQAINTWSL